MGCPLSSILMYNKQSNKKMLLCQKTTLVFQADNWVNFHPCTNITPKEALNKFRNT